MSKPLLQDFEESQGFDCSAFLGHNLQWPANECPNKLNGFTASSNTGEYYYTKQHVIKSTSCRDWGVLPQDAVSQKKKPVKKSTEEQYYASEYNALIEWMNEENIIVPPPPQFTDKREEIQKLSQLADEALGREFHNSSSPSCDRYTRISECEDLATQVAIKAIESPRCVLSTGGFQDFVVREPQVASKAIEQPRRVLSPEGFQDFVKEQLVGFGDCPEEPKEAVVRKRRLCRHFVKGFCMRGNSCAFLHDQSIFCSDEQKVFLGGLPLHLTPLLLKTKLEELGLKVLNKPRIMRGFTPQVCLGSVEEAEKLIAQQYIYIGDQRVDVRPYQDEDKLRQVFPSVVKRSVFLGGLSENTTGEMIMTDLQRLDVKVEALPVVKNGFAPRVVLGSLKNAKMLVALKRVMVNGTVVDVRPYVNFRKRY